MRTNEACNSLNEQQPPLYFRKVKTRLRDSKKETRKRRYIFREGVAEAETKTRTCTASSQAYSWTEFLAVSNLSFSFVRFFRPLRSRLGRGAALPPLCVLISFMRVQLKVAITITTAKIFSLVLFAFSAAFGNAHLVSKFVDFYLKWNFSFNEEFLVCFDKVQSSGEDFKVLTFWWEVCKNTI